MRTLFYLLLSLAIIACGDSDQKKQSEKEDQTVDLNSLKEKTTLTFPSKDSLLITADYYPNASARKLILLFHQAEFSRGEYLEIAPKLVESGYACMAVDLRSGRAVNDVINETFNRALKKDLPTKFLNARQDMQAAIEYAKEHSDNQLVWWGSSYSASLDIMEGKDESRVAKVVAFSPGEYFNNQNTVKSKIPGYQKPVFVTCTKNEQKMVEDIFNLLPDNFTTKYNHAADHGSKSLWSEKPGSDSLMMHIVNFL
ncbi:hypothetical protein GYB22_01845 [bacterium]|nr:hypothetical protein [bacterium]